MLVLPEFPLSRGGPQRRATSSLNPHRGLTDRAPPKGGTCSSPTHPSSTPFSIHPPLAGATSLGLARRTSLGYNRRLSAGTAPEAAPVVALSRDRRTCRP